MKKSKQLLSGSYRIALFIIISILAVIIFMNVVIIKSNETDRIEVEGQMRLSSIAGRVDSSLYRS